MDKLTTEDKNIIIEGVVGGSNNLEFLSKKSSSRIHLYKVMVSGERASARRKMQTNLRKYKIRFSEKRINSLSSEPITEFVKSGVTVRILYKPASGGMNETTLNSTITELVPCLMFHNNINATDVNKLQQELYKIKHATQKCYVDVSDSRTGQEFVEKFETSSKYVEKMKNAIAINKFLIKTNQRKPIKTVYWTYRKKPSGIPSNSPADIVISFADGEMLGVSLKAGTSSSKEPLLNTYINPVFEFFGGSSRVATLRKKLYNSVYSKIENIPSSQNYDKLEKNITIENLELLKRTDETEYNKLYDDALQIIRDALVKTLTENKTKFLKYVKSEILRESNVAVILIKATGTSYEEKRDSNKLKKLLPQTISIDAKVSSSSKQNFCIELKGKQGCIGKMNWSVRTNKVAPLNKLGQFFNMAVKYNGLD